MSFARIERFTRSFGFRLNAFYAALFFASLTLLGVLANYRIAASIEGKDREIISAKLKEYRARFDESGLPALTELFSDPEQRGREHYVVRVSDPFNQSLFLHVPKKDLVFDPASVQVQVGEDERKWLKVRASSDGSTWNVGATELLGGLWLQVGDSDERSAEMIGHLRSGFTAILGVALLFGILGGAYFTRQVLRPIRQLRDTTRAVVSAQDMTARVPVGHSADEMDELSRLFNRMLEKNQSLIQGMKDALDNVAHDLRTPLTRLRGVAELALVGAGNVDAMKDALADCIEESDRVLTMLRTLMDISEAETGVMRLEREGVDLAEVAREVLDLYGLVAQDKGIIVARHLDKGVEVSGDPTRLRQAIGNLIDNAIKYTNPGGSIEVRVTQTDTDAELKVRDTGIGISPEDQTKIWQRLYRADKSRKEKGLGLGLSFVKAIVEAHGGAVQVDSEVDRGSTFTVQFPHCAGS